MPVVRGVLQVGEGPSDHLTTRHPVRRETNHPAVE
nr:hypothetical protein [Mycobacterium simulans]